MAEVTARHRRGTVRRRGNRWQVDVVIGGRRVRRSAPTCDAANELLEALVEGASLHSAGGCTIPRDGQPPAHTESTVPLLLERYLASTRLHCRPRTIRTTEAAVKRLGDFFVQVPASHLSRIEIDRYVAARLEDRVGPHTPNREFACLRAALNQARDDGLIERAPKIRMLRTLRSLRSRTRGDWRSCIRHDSRGTDRTRVRQRRRVPERRQLGRALPPPPVRASRPVAAGNPVRSLRSRERALRSFGSRNTCSLRTARASAGARPVGGSI